MSNAVKKQTHPKKSQYTMSCRRMKRNIYQITHNILFQAGQACTKPKLQELKISRP